MLKCKEKYFTDYVTNPDFLHTLNYYRQVIDDKLGKYLIDTIEKSLFSDDSFIELQKKLLIQYCSRGGKRLRPILTLLTYKSVGGKNIKDILLPSLAFELFHNYTLIHDDIYDEDEKRRNEWSNHILFSRWFRKRYPTASSSTLLYKDLNSRFGVVSGFINGKILLSLAPLPILEARISEEKKIAGIKLLQDVSIFDNMGQAIDLSLEHEDIKVNEKDYYDMVLYKTGRLFQVSAEWGVILGGGSDSQREVIKRYMAEIAIVFQIKDDLLDIDSGGDKGRGLGSDIKKGKKTLLVIHALRNASEKQKEIILRILGNQRANQVEIESTIKLFYDLGSIDYCHKIAEIRLKEAEEILNSARPSINKDYMAFFNDFSHLMISRKS